MDSMAAAHQDHAWEPLSATIDDMPKEVLKGVAAYLPRGWVAMFAAAMTAPSSAWAARGRDRRRASPSGESQAIMLSGHHDWETLNTSDVAEPAGEVVPPPVRRVSGDDLASVLSVMGARERLKNLLLDPSVLIEGDGLAYLRGSKCLEIISLDPNRHNVEPVDSLMSPAVVDLVESVLSVEGNFRCLHVPAAHFSEVFVHLTQLMETDHVGEKVVVQSPEMGCLLFGGGSEEEIERLRSGLQSGAMRGLETCYKCNDIATLRWCIGCDRKIRCLCCRDVRGRLGNRVLTCDDCGEMCCEACKGKPEPNVTCCWPGNRRIGHALCFLCRRRRFSEGGRGCNHCITQALGDSYAFIDRQRSVINRQQTQLGDQDAQLAEQQALIRSFDERVNALQVDIERVRVGTGVADILAIDEEQGGDTGLGEALGGAGGNAGRGTETNINVDTEISAVGGVFGDVEDMELSMERVMEI